DEIGGGERGPTNRATVGLPRRVTATTEPLNAAPIVRPDPSADYRTNSTGAPTYSYGGSVGLRAGAGSSRTYGYSGAPFAVVRLNIGIQQGRHRSLRWCGWRSGVGLAEIRLSTRCGVMHGRSSRIREHSEKEQHRSNACSNEKCQRSRTVL